ncbi:MAG: UDP-N-acetylglucosamine 2-epimerase, partial [Candidatus Thorarchaeota archaeon]
MVQLEEVLNKFEVSHGDYGVLTWHRREHVDDTRNLMEIVNALEQLEFPLIFPIHPRTKKRMNETSLEIKNPNIKIIPPLPYDEFMCLVANAGLAISDSGGIQKESYILGTPLVSLHSCTEWVETLAYGRHKLGDISTQRILDDCTELFGKRYESDASVYGDGSAAKKIPPI